MSRLLVRVLPLALAAVLGAVGCGLLTPAMPDVVVELPRAFNLFPGSDVRVLGLTVGRVRDVAVTEGDGVVRVTLDLDADVSLPADVTAHVVQGALLGERFVELEPAYTGGPTLPPGGTIPVERTTVPAEFDEILESLNDALAAIPPDELRRLVRSSAEVLEGRGDQLGRTLERVGEAVSALHAADDELVRLIRHLADLNETLATRDVALGAAIDDYGQLLAMLADEREVIDATLGEVARMVVELRGLVDAHADRADETVAGITRVGRTLERNLDRIDLLLYGQSELFRHAERVMDFEHNWLPLVNQSDDLGRMFRDRLTERLLGLCERAGMPDCSQAGFWEAELPAEVCVPGVLACRDPAGGGPDTAEIALEEALALAVERVPELAEAIAAGPGAAPGAAPPRWPSGPRTGGVW